MPTAVDHRTLLRASVADFIARGTSMARVRRMRDEAREHDAATWRQMAELGWLAIVIPEAAGGLGLGLAEATIVAEGLGRALVPEPYTASVLAAEALARSDNVALRAELLSEIAGGRLIAALAWQEEAGALALENMKTRATRFEGGFRLTGTKRYVVAAAAANGYLIAACTEAQRTVLCWVTPEAPGLRLELEALADGRHFGTLHLDDVSVAPTQIAASEEVAAAALERALDRATVVASAELYGVMSRALELTLDYLRTRVQFGTPIGSFQALQHRAVDLYIQRELASAVLEQTTAAMDQEPQPNTRTRLASRAKARCADAASKITRAAIQLHGAIGFTDEYDAGLYLKRALVLGAWLGNATWHRRRYAALASEGRA